MNAFALDTVRELMEKGMGALAKIMVSPSDELSEKTLLEIHWKELISNATICPMDYLFLSISSTQTVLTIPT
jgi:hypothetical protein